MNISLKPLDQQVIVITGVSSGIGLATALAAAHEGAKLILAARSSQTLEEIVSEITAVGGQAISVHADVGLRVDVEKSPLRRWRNSAELTLGSTMPVFQSTAGLTR